MARLIQREPWVAAGLLVVLMAAVHYDVIFLGRSLIHSNLSNPLDYRPLPQNYGDAMVPLETWTARNLFPHANIRDPGATWWQWEPGRVFLRTAIEQREWPFWDPYVAAGTPAMANMIPAFFFPPYTLVVWLGASAHLLNAYYLFLLWAASFVTFLLLRRHELSFVASLSGAVFVLMSGGLNQNLGSFMGQTVSCLPLALYVTRAFLDHPTRRRAAGMALIYAATALASFPPLLLAVFGLTTLYAATAIATGDCPRGRVSTALGWGAATLLAIALVGFYYGPALLLREAAPQVAAFYRGAGLESTSLAHAYQLLSPTIFGGLQVYLNGPFTPAIGPNIPYVGAVAVLSSLISSPIANARGRTLFLTSLIGTIAILMKLFGLPPVHWVGSLPPFDQIHFAEYFGIPLGFTVAFLGAYGVESVVRGTARAWRIAVVAGLAILALESLRWLAGSALHRPAAAEWLRDWQVLGTITILSAAAVLLTAVGRHRRGFTSAAAWCLLALAAAEGIYNNAYPSPAAWDIFRHPPPYIRVLQEKAASSRVFAAGAPNANTNEAFGIASLDSLMAFNPPRVFELYRRYARPPSSVFMREATALPPEPVLDQANVSFVSVLDVLPGMLDAARNRNYTLRFDDGYVSLFERPTPPRFWFSSEFRVLPREAVLDAVGTAGAHEIILENHPGFDSISSRVDEGPVTVEEYHRNSASLVVEAPRAGLLYASESFFEGWTASVNGTPAPILPANYAFRAIVVPPGRSRVTFTYWPPGLTAGLWLSGMSSLVVLGLAVKANAG